MEVGQYKFIRQSIAYNINEDHSQLFFFIHEEKIGLDSEQMPQKSNLKKNSVRG